MVPLDDITLVPEPSRKQLNERQLVDYRAEREDCLKWLLAVGADEDGEPRALVETDSADVRNWAENKVEAFKRQADLSKFQLSLPRSGRRQESGL